MTFYLYLCPALKKFKKIPALFFLIFSLAFLFSPLPRASAADIFPDSISSDSISLHSLFWKRAWPAMDEIYASGGNLTARDHALMANALRIQNRWGEAEAVLEKHRASFPAEVRPYADMTLLLAYEKSGRISDARELVSEFEKNAPEDLRYYAAYARLRTLESGDVSGQEKALEKMFGTADTKDRKISALRSLIKLQPASENRRAYALALLEQSPASEEAREILADAPKPWPPEMNLAMGVYAYLKNDHKTAQTLLAAVPQGPGWMKAAYYRAYSLEKSKRYAEAINLFGSLALSGNEYAESAVRRIAAVARVAEKAEKANAMAALRKIIDERKGKVQARAMLSLAGLLSAGDARKIEDGLIQAYPDSAETARILWRRGWDAWSANKFPEAAAYWQRLCAPGASPAWEARALYWLGAAQMSMNRAKEAGDTYSVLLRRNPLSYYAFLAKPEAVKPLDGVPEYLASEASVLEKWGFVYYAKLKTQRNPGASGKDLFRAMELSEWLGEGGVYAQARALSRFFESALYRKGLEYLYPRPFARQVDAACAEYGVENNLVWAVMRQESAFNPNAKSHAGASGLMQLMPGTAGDEAKRIGLGSYKILDVDDNVKMGTAHLARLTRSFGRLDWVMAAYNAGPGNARKWLADGGSDLASDYWIEQIRFAETCDYVQRVSGNLEVYRMLYPAGLTNENSK